MPEGPYMFNDVSVTNWCHNPAIIVTSAGGFPVWALFHIGDGTGSSVKNCSKADEPKASSVATGSSLHTSSSPNGY